MKFLLYSQYGEGADVLWRIAQEGNDCALFVKDKVYKSVFEGMLPKVSDPDKFIDKETIIIFDLSGLGKTADAYKKKGHFVYGASEFMDDLEEDREFGYHMMETAGIKIPTYKEFTDFESAREYVRETNKRMVFKPSGNMPCKLTYVSKGADELEKYLHFVEKRFGSQIENFILQDFIEGIVVSTEFFCDGKKFIWPPNHTVEVKKSMNNDLGPSTGCAGNITWICDEDKIVREGPMLMERICIHNDVRGQIDLNAVVNESGVYGLEWTPRFGYDATPTFITLMDDDIGKFFSDIARGNGPKIGNFNTEYAAGVRLSIPPYPIEPQHNMDSEKISPNIGVPILNSEKYRNDLYFYEVMEEDGQLTHSGGTGVIACALSVNKSEYDAVTNCNKICEEINVPDKQYRTDLAEVLTDMVYEVEEYA